MRFLSFTLCFSAVTVCHAALFASWVRSGPPVVDLGYAKYQGVTNKTSNTTTFLGIRYAASPAGERRWHTPTYPVKVRGVQKADTQPPKCYQSVRGTSSTNPFLDLGLGQEWPESNTILTEQMVLNGLDMKLGQAMKKRSPNEDDVSEDCLFLNVHIPGTKVPSESLPVVVFIHDGGYHSGSARMFDGDDLVQESGNNIIAVIIQFRLGLFGFLAGEEVKRSGSLNVGLLDQQFALQWVQSHIKQFGGDPDQVTIWGKTSGAGAVLQHIVANDGETNPPLFKRAITISAFLPPQYDYNHDILKYLYSEVTKKSGCHKVEDTLACLRHTDIDTLQKANVGISGAGFYGTFTWTPCVDGQLIRQRPVEALKQSRVNGRALMASDNFNEGVIFVNASSPPHSNPSYAGNIMPSSSRAIRDVVGRLYGDAYKSRTRQIQAMAMYGESFLKCPSYFIADAYLVRDYPVYKAQFAVEPAYNPSDIGLYFPSTFPRITNDTSFIDSFAQSFLAFAISGNPNAHFDGKRSTTPYWDDYADFSEMLFEIDENDGKSNIRQILSAEAFLDRCSIWQDIAAQTPR
ncbi:hypothetical protein HGRIS_000024 [Hohenbuehelia grisea]|uniref:Carboxylesterase type B domain-containing protein n=1 Tax=Hohenbuehelia grisea TaxID=104357 RepID=A0ABR3JPU0_9AGAR